jgi:hypothetical protein
VTVPSVTALLRVNPGGRNADTRSARFIVIIPSWKLDPRLANDIKIELEPLLHADMALEWIYFCTPIDIHAKGAPPRFSWHE